ncbi:HIT domain-containing protein [Candidatus Woesearchaeota archaeon]|nr:HIT domain-containing protein [Candidatus Woesearchaeota archaeon]
MEQPVEGQQPQMTEEQRKELEEKLKDMSPEEIAELQKQQCIFCQIVSGKIPSKKIYEDDICVAVLDINPATIGHVLLMPKEHYMIMPQVPENILGHVFMVAKHISQAMLRKLKVEGTSVFVANGFVAGQKAQHFLVHVIPRKGNDGLLNIHEKLVDKELLDKTRNVLIDKLGGKVKEDPKKPKVEEKQEEKVVEKEEEREVKEVEKQVEEKEEPAEKEKEEGYREVLDRFVEEKFEPGDSKDSKDSEEEKDEDQDNSEDDKDDNKTDNEKDEAVDLDDIANLFK